MNRSIMTLVALILLSIQVSCVKKSQCNIYKCTTKRSDSACATIAKSGTVYDISISKCKKNFYCGITAADIFKPNNAITTTIKCTEIYKSKTSTNTNVITDVNVNSNTTTCVKNSKYPGESCKANCDECIGSICNNDKCVASKNKDEVCNLLLFSGDCPVGTACISVGEGLTKCTEQLVDGKTCNNDFECNNEAGCNLGKCTRYNSVENGSQTSDAELFCKSRLARTDGTVKICDELTLTESKCELETDDICTYKWKAGNQFTSECQCDNDGKQSRSCAPVEIPKAVTATPNVHTKLRFKDQNVKEALSELTQNFGSTVKSWWGSFVSYVKDVADGTTVRECIEEVINSSALSKLSALLILFVGLIF